MADPKAASAPEEPTDRLADRMADRVANRVAASLGGGRAAPPRTIGVPWRIIWAVIGSVVLTLGALQILEQVGRVLSWFVVALFFAVVLNPAVDFLEERARVRRGVATALVMLAFFSLLAGLLYAFISPLVDQGREFADELPTYIDEAQVGRGPFGDIVERFNLQDWIEENRESWTDYLADLGAPALSLLRSVLNGIVAFLTIIVLTVLLLVQAPRLTQAVLILMPDQHQRRIGSVARDCARAVSGYVTGNLLISLIAGGATWVFLVVAGVPYAGVLALWVAFCDLIPLVGATLGAVPGVLVGFSQSVGTGVATLVFFVLYQQFENHVIGVVVMSRTVKINPLGVLISILVAIELFGFLGALLAVPAAGVIQVVVRDIYDERTGRLKIEPTIGADEVAPVPAE